MSDVVVLEDGIDASWWRKLHVMAGSGDALKPYLERVPGWATLHTEANELRIHHLRAAWPVREPVSISVRLGTWPMVAWWIGDDKASKAILDGAEAFALASGVDAQYAFLKQVPAKAEEFADVKGITLMRASWVPDGFIAIARGGMQIISKDW